MPPGQGGRPPVDRTSETTWRRPWRGPGRGSRAGFSRGIADQLDQQSDLPRSQVERRQMISSPGHVGMSKETRQLAHGARGDQLPQIGPQLPLGLLDALELMAVSTPLTHKEVMSRRPGNGRGCTHQYQPHRKKAHPGRPRSHAASLAAGTPAQDHPTPRASPLGCVTCRMKPIMSGLVILFFVT